MPRRPRVDKPPIAILTDFGADSFYVGAMKGAILAAHPGAVIADVSHAVREYEVQEASFVLARVFDVFPEGTVFLAVVDPGVGGRRGNLIVESRRRFVVTPDNGLVSDVHTDHGLDRCYAIRDEAVRKFRRHAAFGRTFLGRDVFAPIASALATGEPAARLGTAVDRCELLELPGVDVDEGRVSGRGRYVDAFGNIMTNITGGHLEAAFGPCPLAKLRAMVNNNIEVVGVREYFSQGEVGELLVILNSWNRIEVTVNMGRAAGRFADAPIRVELTSR